MHVPAADAIFSCDIALLTDEMLFFADFSKLAKFKLFSLKPMEKKPMALITETIPIVLTVLFI